MMLETQGFEFQNTQQVFLSDALHVKLGSVLNVVLALELHQLTTQFKKFCPPQNGPKIH